MSDYGRRCRTCRVTSTNVKYGLCSDCNVQAKSFEIHSFERHTRELKEMTTEERAELSDMIAKSVKDNVAKTPAGVKPAVAGKPPISLIPTEAILETAKAFDYGTGKHGRYAYRNGVEFTKLIDAAGRHLLAIQNSEDVDEESKCLHAACVMSNMAMLIWMMKHNNIMDDRWKK